MRYSILVALFVITLPMSGFAEHKIGFIGGFSGPGKAFGDSGRNGFEMAREEFGNQGPTVIYEDDQFDPKKTVAAFNKLLNRDKVDLVVVLGSTPASAIAPLAERARVPMIAWASAEHISRGRHWVIRSWPGASEEGAKLASKAKELQLKKVATIAYTDQYALGVTKGFTENFKESVSLGEVSPTELEFSALASQVRNRGIDGVMMCLSVGQGARLAKLLRQLQLQIPILGCETINSSAEIELSNGALSGAWFATIGFLPDFESRYKARFNVDAVIGGAAVHYELYRLLSEIWREGTSREQLISGLLKTRNRNSVFGHFDIATESGDQLFKLPVVLRQAK
jgi:branched-chain amino acid transport system substrate-binding protein